MSSTRQMKTKELLFLIIRNSFSLRTGLNS